MLRFLRFIAINQAMGTHSTIYQPNLEVISEEVPARNIAETQGVERIFSG